jgi:predicted nucleic acid-binding protein
MMLMKKTGGDLVPRLGNYSVLDLTTYEMGNILWKEGYLSRSLTREEVASLASTTQQILALVERISIGSQDVVRTLELAENEGLTFYDASYLQAAIDRNLSLVTEDGKLRRAAKKHVTVMTAFDL